MKKCMLLFLILLATLSQAQNNLLKKRSRIINKSANKVNSVFVYRATTPLNTAILFPKPPEILGFRDTTSLTSTFLVNACVTNLQTLNDIQLTVNGEKPVILSQMLSTSNDCKGLQYSCSLTLPLPMNTISLEARNEGGASVRYAVVTVTP